MPPSDGVPGLDPQTWDNTNPDKLLPGVRSRIMQNRQCVFPQVPILETR